METRSTDIAPMAFCETCGDPFPWATREQRLGKLWSIIDFEGELDPAEFLAVTEQLAMLSEPESIEDEDAQVKAGGMFQRMAPKAWQVAQPVMVTLMSSGARKALGLP